MGDVINFSGSKVEIKDDLTILGCESCGNKTFVVYNEKENGCPLLMCSVCGNHIHNIVLSDTF